MQPFGGYKGYGLGLAFEILSGALVGTPIGSKGGLVDRGALILLIDPEAFGQSPDQFKEHVTTFLQEVTDDTTTNGSLIHYPGQRGEEKYQKIISSGEITLPVVVYEQLVEVCK